MYTSCFQAGDTAPVLPLDACTRINGDLAEHEMEILMKRAAR